MMRFISVFFLSLALLVCFPVWAGSQEGKITGLFIRASDGLVYFFMDGTSQGKPACAGLSYWIIRDENSNAGKQQLAALLVAKASGQTIVVSGANRCDRWSDGEDVDYIRY
jgi:hypothetical protein